MTYPAEKYEEIRYKKWSLSTGPLFFVKPGGLSSTEAAVMGIPLIHLPPIPGCETRNADFFYTNGMNYKITATKQNIEQAVSLITDTAKCTEMISNQHEIISKNSVANICDFAENMTKKVV